MHTHTWLFLVIDRRRRKKAQHMEHTNMMDKRSFFVECFFCCVIMRKNTTIRQHKHILTCTSTLASLVRVLSGWYRDSSWFLCALIDAEG